MQFGKKPPISNTILYEYINYQSVNTAINVWTTLNIEMIVDIYWNVKNDILITFYNSITPVVCYIYTTKIKRIESHISSISIIQTPFLELRLPESCCSVLVHVFHEFCSWKNTSEIHFLIELLYIFNAASCN